MNRIMCGVAFAVGVLVLGSFKLCAQPQLPQPDASPKSTIVQTIGISEVEVVYHRPGVKNRPVFGSLVPYGDVWRAGANENTTVRFSHPFRVEGNPLPAGTYGLHMIPTKDAWTIIFNKNSTSWGSYFYKETEDALRFTVRPGEATHHEWLQYEFDALTDTSAVLALCWEKVRIPLHISFDTPEIVIANARDAYLRGLAGFTWQGFNQAAQYCLRNNTDIAEALQWIDRSIGINENFTNLRTKASLLEKVGKKDEVQVLQKRSLTLATEAEVNLLGYNYLNANKTKEAVELFQKNVKDHPDSWNVYDSLGEGLEKLGDTNGAIKNYQIALSKVGDDTNRKRITTILAQLKKAK